MERLESCYRKQKNKDVSLPPFLENTLFRRGVSKVDKEKLWWLARDEMSMNKEEKLSFLVSLSGMKRRRIKHWIKELSWREKVLKQTLLNLLIENND